MTLGKDRRTHDLSLVILHEEIDHEEWFQELLQVLPGISEETT